MRSYVSGSVQKPSDQLSAQDVTHPGSLWIYDAHNALLELAFPKLQKLASYFFTFEKEYGVYFFAARTTDHVSDIASTQSLFGARAVNSASNYHCYIRGTIMMLEFSNVSENAKQQSRQNTRWEMRKQRSAR